MSWFSKNYEKAALGGAVAVALGLSYFGWSKYSSVEENFAASVVGAGNNDPAVKGADAIPKAAQAIKIDRDWTPALDGERPVDLFTSIPLFIKSTEPEKAVDLLKDAPVHPPIPNIWWLENKIDPGFGDSPSRDPDSDGFSNIDEFNAKTDPNNAKSFPSPIRKLMYVKDESLTWAIRPGYGDGAGGFGFSYVDGKRRANKVAAGEMIKPDGLFFAKEPMANRFKLLGSEVVKEMNKKINIEVEVTYVRIEDQKPNKKGTVYKIPAPLSEQRLGEHQKYDRSAVFSLEALGKEGAEFKVEENTKFALPPDAPNKDYLLKTVTPESVTVEYTDEKGATKTIQINKGALPNFEE